MSSICSKCGKRISIFGQQPALEFKLDKFRKKGFAIPKGLCRNCSIPYLAEANAKMEQSYASTETNGGSGLSLAKTYGAFHLGLFCFCVCLFVFVAIFGRTGFIRENWWIILIGLDSMLLFGIPFYTLGKIYENSFDRDREIREIKQALLQVSLIQHQKHRQSFRLCFSGELMKDNEYPKQQAVLERLSALTKIPSRTLVDGSIHVIKNDLSIDEALKNKQSLALHGIVSQIYPQN